MKTIYKLIQKAYQINLSKLDEYWLYEDEICYAKSNNEARYKLLTQIKHIDWKLNFGEKITYTNIPVIRHPEYDTYLFEGNELTLGKINNILKKRERENDLNNILNDPTIKYCYIKKNGLYYSNDYCGYTDFIIKAGTYTKEDAIPCALSCDELTIIPIDIIKHNELINSEIEILKKKLLCHI